MQWAERENKVLLTACLTVSLIVYPHPMTPLKGLSRFLIRNNISREKQTHAPLHTLQLRHPFPGACFVFKKNDNRKTSEGRQAQAIPTLPFEASSLKMGLFC